MKVTVQGDVKRTWDDHHAAIAASLEGLTALQTAEASRGLHPFPTIQTVVDVFDVWPGETGTPYPWPLSGKPGAVAVLSGHLVEAKRGLFAPQPARVVAVVEDPVQNDLVRRLCRGNQVIVFGDLVWLDEFEYLVGGGHQCFGETVGSRFTFRLERATLRGKD